ncbi:hypothetical protein MA16_Dca004109 [Dendrobium catenatum]|uniref:Uncharacterized protein n=1 Tax=Dendrobium catenatum TaxID=906689 RepID=A0A2I0X2G7_9ASPA|nr:hypothetical protein MA16_Dca004109 [Dendrobium catenatum]
MLVLDIPVACPAIVHVSENIVDLEACGDINKGVDDNLPLTSGGEFILVAPHVEAVNNEMSEVNMMMLIDSSSGLVIASHDSPLADFEVALSPNKEVSNVNVTLIDVPILLFLVMP